MRKELSLQTQAFLPSLAGCRNPADILEHRQKAPQPLEEIACGAKQFSRGPGEPESLVEVTNEQN